MKYDLGWGNSRAVRHAFLETVNNFSSPLILDKEKLSQFDYPAHEGNSQLVALTKKIIKRQTGNTYKHVLLTNGATGGVVIALRAYQQRRYEFCHTRNAPHYLRYPRMISSAGLIHCDESCHQWSDISVVLMDIPSNPLNIIAPPEVSLNVPVILDGVYLNKVYMNDLIKTPPHDVFVGSYSKLLGINGIRVGWIATNDTFLYERMKDLVASEYCGLSSADSQSILHWLNPNFDWVTFERYAGHRLDFNREDFSKLEKYFENKPVDKIGMFYYAKVDKAAKKLLKKADVLFTPGSAMGTDDNFGRFNLGQDCKLLKEAVHAILKADKR